MVEGFREAQTFCNETSACRSAVWPLTWLAGHLDGPLAPQASPIREEIMKTSLIALCGVVLLGLAGSGRAQADDLTFLSTQLRPLEEAQRARTEILKNAPMAVAYVP